MDGALPRRLLALEISDRSCGQNISAGMWGRPTAALSSVLAKGIPQCFALGTFPRLRWASCTDAGPERALGVTGLGGRCTRGLNGREARWAARLGPSRLGPAADRRACGPLSAPCTGASIPRRMRDAGVQCGMR